MKIFLTGASGYIGYEVGEALVRAGHEVAGLTRTPEKAPKLALAGMRPVLGDLNKPETYRDAAAASDAMVHLGFDYGAGAVDTDRRALETLIAAARSGLRERLLVYTSGVWVLGPRRARPTEESDPPDPAEIVSWRPSHEELALAASGEALRVAVVRPGCVYGGRGGLYGRLLGEILESRTATIVGDGSNRWATVYLGDLVELYRLLVQAGPRREIYHATDGGSEPVRQAAEALLEAVGGGSVECLPLHKARRRLGPLADALALDQSVSSEKARRELGWKPKLSSAAWNAQTILAEWHEGAQAPSVA